MKLLWGGKRETIQVDPDIGEVLMKLLEENHHRTGFFWEGYPAIGYKRGRIMVHHIVMGRSLIPGSEVDHINGDKRNGRRYNLRWVTQKENANGFKPPKGKIPITGIRYRATHLKPYQVAIKEGHLAEFKTLAEACLCLREALLLDKNIVSSYRDMILCQLDQIGE